ncbi:hypothetical protein H3H36_16505 [Duganella sp. FT3S]|uniref:Glycosyltransferase RgtA/B/C/D-like domain-containing protein n=1 Tax=Rugamonas fusca TaxID=2758568 RepID=A0A7W2EJ93_9BURK|nr:hypothetical protein [Rugamonas fusca]MBA5606960.1 hypothetical protein [Rugamonas fusca]
MTSPPRRSPPGLFARVPLPVAWAGLCFALGAAAIFQYPLNHDVAWLLAMAGRARGGARLYVDLIELNPPLIIWLSMPVTALADWLRVAPGTVYRVLVLALALACVGWAAALARDHRGGAAGALLLPPLAYVAVALAGYDFGQREHLALLLSLPYLAQACVRLHGAPVRRRGRLAAAALAAIGFAIKPYFLLVPALVEGVLVLRSRRGPDGGVWLMGAIMCAYLAAILWLTPDYLPLARTLAHVYGAGYLGIGRFDFLHTPNFLIGAICATLAWIAGPAPRGAALPLSAAAAGFAGAALLQNKGWNYHWYPVAALAWLLFALAAAEVLARPGRLPARAVAPLVGGVMAVLAALSLLAAPHKAALENPAPALFSPVIRELGGGPVLVWSNAVRAAYPLVTEPDIGTASRLPTMSLLSAAIVARQARVEAYLRDIVVADLLRAPPNVLVVESQPWGPAPSFDFIAYLAADARAAPALRGYRLARQVAGYRFYQRLPAPAALGGRDDGQQRDAERQAHEP